VATVQRSITCAARFAGSAIVIRRTGNISVAEQPHVQETRNGFRLVVIIFKQPDAAIQYAGQLPVYGRHVIFVAGHSRQPAAVAGIMAARIAGSAIILKRPGFDAIHEPGTANSARAHGY
jgi:hypothetical protein